ncbi:MAG TPA: hypothetical protein VFB82_15265 [Blastocatellia bacterium]|nr:hypothetical protein [Blastocatellia bacterium]
MLFVTDDGEPQLDFEFIRDTSLQINVLGSFVVGDANDALAYLGPESSAKSQPASEALHNQVRLALEKLSDDSSDELAWSILMHIVGDLPIYEDGVGDLKAVLNRVDFEALRAINTSTAERAVQFATLQLCYLNDDGLKAKLKSSLVRWAGASADNRDQLDGDEFKLSAHRFLESALLISLQPGEPVVTSMAFGGLLQELLAAWPRLAEYYGMILLGLALDLPANHLHGVWPALMRCRALSAKPFFLTRAW